MNPENAMWLLDVMTNEARRMMAVAESQSKRIAELEAKMRELETPATSRPEAKP